MSDTAERVDEGATLDHVVIRFAGDSGDGMQLTGDRFTSVSALVGNDLATFPEFPAEIRAPAGTLAGVSAFQVHISDHEIHTPGDQPDVLVAMNPAALKSQLGQLRSGGTLILNADAFDERNLTKAGYAADPRDDGSLAGYVVHQVPMTSLTQGATESLGVKQRDAERSKNFFALGLVSWMYTRPVDPTLEWINQRFARNELVRAANEAAFRAGHAYGETAELEASRVQVRSAPQKAGTYTNVTGNTSLAWGMIAAGHCARLPIFLGSYPITPASDILHELSKHKNFGVRTFQAEDEIAGVGAALGAAYGGHLAFTTTSGPGVALKGETIGLAVSLELPLVIVDIQRGGPSTGLPTKTEASDLLMAMFGRHGESPLPIVSASTSADCFDAVIEASRIALKYRTPVVLLSDGYLANGAEPWRLPEVDALPDISVPFATELNGTDAAGEPIFLPYLRDPETLARPWAVPGTAGLEHRIGGIEKEDRTGNISYDPANHQLMTDLRKARIEGIANDIPLVEVDGDGGADLLMVGWGSTRGSIISAVERARARGRRVDRIHLTHLNPFPRNLGEILGRYRTIVVPELNTGQLTRLLRSDFLVDARCLSKVQGLPFTAAEIDDAIEEALR
jgi:2-oxoglutarate/2-oxoacid ferredoxin oxidoreductase subunit alpha